MKLITQDAAAEMVQSGWTVASAGFVGAGHAEAITSALERRFLATGLPRDLTLVYSAGQGDRATRGVNHFGNAGMTCCVVGGHWRSATRLGQLALDEECEGYNLPQGVLTHLYRAIAGGKPGVLTKIGLHTFIDPRTEIDARYQGGAVNGRAIAAARKAAETGARRWVEVERFRGEDYLFYPAFKIDCALIRATAADPHGNLSTHEEAFHHELLAIAQAARNSGGIVIAQVQRLVDHHDNLQAIHVPGILIDAVVVCENPQEHHMTFGEPFNAAYHTAWRGRQVPPVRPAPIALDARTIAQRRALMEVVRRAPRVVNLGVGMPAGVATLAAAEGIDGFTLTVEAGPIGGTPADGLSFGASSHPEAVIDQPAQFDFYDGGGIDLAILGLAELDAQGNVNVSKFGEHGKMLIAGVGGFVNITQSAKALVFMGTFTAGGLQVAANDGRLEIVTEGRLRKIVSQVSHLSFNGPYVASLGIPVLYITERAVFAIQDGVLTLIEIAPGIALQKDILDQCDTPVAVAANLRPMDERLFNAAPMTWLTDLRG
ncbi:MAG: malonate decarboxylase subunit alpha [Herminiimonas sp.]|nr:malonate decarboxylase subunit alpha [Herminiimonas sp.]